jgi:hypothetical protein
MLAAFFQHVGLQRGESEQLIRAAKRRKNAAHSVSVGSKRE